MKLNRVYSTGAPVILIYLLLQQRKDKGIELQHNQQSWLQQHTRKIWSRITAEKSAECLELQDLLSSHQRTYGKHIHVLVTSLK